MSADLSLDRFTATMKERPLNLLEQFMVGFDNMMIPHWSNYLSPIDVEQLRRIATSLKLAGNMSKKLKMIDEIMTARGFGRFAGGTNRVVYKYYNDKRFLAKIAIDRVGMSDNPAEYNNQHLIKPFCSKMFHVTPCGTVGFVERLEPLLSLYEFQEHADSIFWFLTEMVLGKYVVDDIGVKFFMNYGFRRGFGPCLLDYPYIFELDGRKLFCTVPDFWDRPCGGEITYDPGFNKLICLKCGKQYNAAQLRADISANKIVIARGGTRPMKVMVMQGDNVMYQSGASNFVIDPKQAKDQKRPNVVAMSGPVRVGIMQGDQLISGATPPQNPVKEERKLTPEDIVPPEPGVSDQTAETSSEKIIHDPPPDSIYKEGDRYIDPEEMARQCTNGMESQLPEVEEENISQEVPAQPIPAPSSSTTEQKKQQADKRRHVVGNPYGSNFIPDSPADAERMSDY